MSAYDMRPDPIRNKLKDKLLSLRAQGYTDDQIMDVAPKLRQEVDAATRGPGPWSDRYTLPAKADRLRISNINLQNQANAIEAEPGPSLAGEIGGAFKDMLNAIKDPQKRREIERGLSDTITFGGAEALTKKIAPLFGDESFSDEQAAKDSEAAGPLYRTGGAVAGAFLPGGSKKIIDSAGALATRVAAKTGSRLGGIAAGTGMGLASVPVTSGLVAGAQEAIGQGDPLGAPRAAWEAAKEAGTSPVAMGLGAIGGAGAGYAGGLRGGAGQAAEDIALRQEFGGRPSITQGAKGGSFEDPRIKGLRGSTAEQGNVARQSAEDIGTQLGKRFDAEVGQPYAAGKAEMAASGADEGLMDMDPVQAAAMKLMQSEAPRKSVKGAIQSEVLDVLDNYRDADGNVRMPVGKVNEFRQKLADLARVGTPETGPKDRQLSQLWDEAKGIVDDTGYGDLNTAYSKGKGEFQKSFRQLGAKRPMAKLPEGPGADLPRDRALNQMGDRLFRQGEKARLTGKEAADLADFAQRHPEYELTMRLPELLAAKERLSFRLPEGGLLPSVRGSVASNIEPLEANVAEPIGRSMRTLGPTAGAVGNPIMRAILADQERQQRLSDLVRSQARER